MAACSSRRASPRVAAVERGHAALQQFLGLPLPLGERAARPIDVRARAGVAAVEKQRARPDVDGEFVVGGEVMVEAGEQQLLDFGIAIRVRRGIECPRRIRARGIIRRIGAKRIGTHG